MHRSQRFFQFWNASWNVFFGTARRSRIELSSTASTFWNRRPHSEDFNFGNKKKSAGAKPGKYRGWETTFVSCFVKNSRITSASVSRRGTNFAATRRVCSLSVKIRWHELLYIPTSSATSRIVGRRFLMNHSKHFLNVIVVHWRGRPSRFGVVFDGRSAPFETLVPLVTLYTAQTILSISLLQHLKSLCKSVSQFETEFDANVLLLKIPHFLTCKKSPRVLNTHSFKRV